MNLAQYTRKTAVKAFKFPTVLIDYQGEVKRFLIPSSSDTLNDAVRVAFSVPPHWSLMLSLLVTPDATDAGTESKDADADQQAFQCSDEILLPIDVAFLEADVYIYQLRVFAAAPIPALIPDMATIAANGSVPVPTAATAQVLPELPPMHSYADTTVAAVDNTDGGNGDSVPVLSMNSKAANVVTALYDYGGRSSVEISFSAGDKIRVVAKYSDAWWKGEIVGHEEEGSGYFPSNYVYGALASDFQTDSDPMQDSEYFESYNTLYIHHQMLSDDARTSAYADAIRNLQSKVAGKIVMDIGCGSGILSALCAKAGAKHVYAVDASDIIKVAAARVVQENNLGDIITLIQGKVEEIVLPNSVNKVDVIISEWMGTFLVCESMIGSVLKARAAWLSNDGIMMPSDSTLFLCPICIDDYYNKHVAFWDDVYGITMKCLVPQAKKTFFHKPVYDRLIQPDELISEPVAVWNIDLMTAIERDLEVNRSQFEFVISRNAVFHGFGSWFDVVFDADGCQSITLSTSPHHEGTHWKHVMFILPEPLKVNADDRITGTIEVNRNKFWRRHFEATVEFVVSSDPEQRTHKHFFEMWR